MIDQQLSNRIKELKLKYLEENLTESDKDFTCSDYKKAKKIKKRLLSLEKERCHRLIEHQDIQSIDDKIAILKASYISNQMDSDDKEEI